jgi:hypothetical protein
MSCRIGCIEKLLVTVSAQLYLTASSDSSSLRNVLVAVCQQAT